jgi:hypothetical protein
MPRFYRVQPKGLSLFGHRSKLGADPVVGVFAFEHPDTLFGTYSWIHISKQLPKYEMVEFEGRLLESPADSEGVVVEPLREIRRSPMLEWLPANGYLAIITKG